MQGLGKKILPEEKRKVEIFLDQLAKPLQGVKRLLRQRGREHLFPAYTLTIGTRTLCRNRNQKIVFRSIVLTIVFSDLEI